MKNLLSALGAVVIAAGGTSTLLTNKTQNEMGSSAEPKWEQVYWNGNHSKVEFSETIPVNDDRVVMRKAITVVMPYHYADEYIRMHLIDADGFSMSWGDTRYGPWNFQYQLINLDQSTYDTSMGHVADDSRKFDSFLTGKVYSDTESSGMAEEVSSGSVGYCWYWYGGDLHFTLLIRQQGESHGSFTGGAIFANIGTGIELFWQPSN